MSKLRIGYHTNAISIGGADIYLRQILSNIDKKKYEVVLFCKKEYPIKELFNGKVDFEIRYFNEGEKIDQRDFPVITRMDRKEPYIKLLRLLWRRLSFEPLKLLFGTFRDIKNMSNILEEYNLDILHSNDGGSEPMIIAARLTRVPLVLASYCVLPDPPHVKKSGDAIRRIIEWFSVRCLDRAIVKTQEAKSIWLKRLKVDNTKFDVIPNGLDLSIFNTRLDTEKIKYELGIGLDTSIVGISARLHPMKGHKYLIQAIPKIIKQIPDIKFLFAGNGFIEDELLSMVKDMGLDSCVKFLGFRNDLDKLTWIYDISVLPSVAYETFGWAIIEAMACKKPVVASNFSGIPEVVEDGVTGILVTPKDPDALAKAIIELLKDRNKAKKMGEIGRRRVEKYFTQDIMLKKTYGLYDQLLNEKKNHYKVAVLSSGLGHVKRGIETWAEDLNNALKEKGIKTMLYKGGGNGVSKDEKVISCIKRDSRLSKALIKAMPSFARRFGFGSGYSLEEVTFALNLLPELIMKRFDIVHLQDPGIANILRMANSIGLIKSKVILAHGTEESFEFIKRFKYLQHLAPYHMEEAMRYGVNGARHFAIANFVNTERYKPSSASNLRKELNIPENAFVVLSVAAIKKHHKRIDYLIEEVSNTNAFLVIAGSKTDQTQELIEYGKSKLKGRIKFLIDFPRDRMQQVYSVADLFILCSLKEMMPIALLEGLSSGLPSIVNKYPVLEWMVGNGGESINMARTGELAKAIPKYMDKDYRAGKKENARKHILKNFSKDIVVKEIIQMYRDIVGSACLNFRDSSNIARI